MGTIGWAVASASLAAIKFVKMLNKYFYQNER